MTVFIEPSNSSAAVRNLFVHCCCNDRLFSYSVPIFIFKLILTIYTVYRAQSFRIRVAKDGFDNFKQTFYNLSTQTHFSEPLDFKISRGGGEGGMPSESPSGSRLRRSKLASSCSGYSPGYLLCGALRHVKNT